MFFLLKCAFWLALVYAAMLYGFGPVRRVAFDDGATKRAPAADVARAGQTAMRAAISDATSSVAAMCAHRPTECLADAARLKALFEASGAVEPVVIAQRTPKARRVDTKRVSLEATVPSPVGTDIPMPVADPRRQGRVSRLTSRL